MFTIAEQMNGLKNRIIPILIGCVLLLGCKTEKTQNNSIASLDTIEKQSAFLLDIFNKDQQVRKDEQAAIQKFGMNSPQHEAAIALLMNTDDSNLLAIESYLSAHPHPIKEKHGREAADTPWLVIHHASAGKGVRKKYFPIFYKAYQDGHLYGRALTMYLNRMYNLQFNSRIEWNRPYNEEEELDTLIQSLGLRGMIKS